MFGNAEGDHLHVFLEQSARFFCLFLFCDTKKDSTEVWNTLCWYIRMNRVGVSAAYMFVH